MSGRLASACLIAGALGAACAARPEMTPTQWAAIETREIDAPVSEVLPAAAAVLLDQGFLFTMSDSEAGLIGAESMRHYAMNTEAYARRGGLGTGAWFGEGAVVWVRPLSTTRTEIRVQVHARGFHVADENAVNDFWTRTQRRVMAAAPAKGG